MSERKQVALTGKFFLDSETKLPMLANISSALNPVVYTLEFSDLMQPLADLMVGQRVTVKGNFLPNCGPLVVNFPKLGLAPKIQVNSISKVQTT